MPHLFSTYSTGENRVTGSILAVLRSLSIDRMERLLGALLEESDFELLHFENQPSKGGAGVPDAVIQGSVRLLIETKTARNSVNLPQIQRHLQRLDESAEDKLVLLIITPDDIRPKSIDEISDNRVVWTSFASIDQFIDEILSDKYEVVSEREAFLLRELQHMMAAENLLQNPKDILIVAARQAWPEYKEYSAYICQPNRSFQHVDRIGFYSKGVVHPIIAKILEVHEEVELRRVHAATQLGKLINRLVEDNVRAERDSAKIILLSSPDSPDTMKLDTEILNDKKSQSGKTVAFTMGHTYVSSEELVKAKTTSDL